MNKIVLMLMVFCLTELSSQEFNWQKTEFTDDEMTISGATQMVSYPDIMMAVYNELDSVIAIRNIFENK